MKTGHEPHGYASVRQGSAMDKVVLRRMNGEEIARGNDRIALVEANKKNLAGANLYAANLAGANLAGACLAGVNLACAYLAGTYLVGANLSGADLSGACLVGANLSEANIYGANLSGVNLTWAKISRANLTGANLSGTNLLGVMFGDCIGNGVEIITIQTDIWTVVRTATVMQIGCERHPIADWWEFADDAIEEMDPRALEWWSRWKPILQSMIEAAPAKDPQENTNGRECPWW